MTRAKAGPDIQTARLQPEKLLENFSDLHPPLGAHEAYVEADRCYFCYDAPCMNACPTGIDIPMFIRQVATGNLEGSAKTIFSANIMGGMCARVCPTESLCEQVCVREAAEGKAVAIGQLQRYATDYLMDHAKLHPFSRAPETGKRMAVVGAGPAGLSCAHRLAMYGHVVSIFEAREKSGGLNEYGIAAYKTVNDFARAEVDFILGIGGIEIKHGIMLGRDAMLDALVAEYDAVFLGIGLPGVNALGIPGEDAPGCIDAVDYIARLRQADDLTSLPVGRNVVVIGGGMTAIDIATQIKLLGAETVTICYRRGPEAMNASEYEQHVAQTNGVTIRYWMQPEELVLDDTGTVVGITMEYTAGSNGTLSGTGEIVTLEADQVFKAIGQSPSEALLAGTGMELIRGRIVVDESRKTSHAKIWAGGDCIFGGDDLTVAAVQDGKVAAEAIHQVLSA